MLVVGFMMLAGIAGSAFLESIEEKEPKPELPIKEDPTPPIDNSITRNVLSAICQGFFS